MALRPYRGAIIIYPSTIPTFRQIEELPQFACTVGQWMLSQCLGGYRHRAAVKIL